MIAACTTDKPFDRPLNDHYLLPSADGMAPADGSLTTNDATRLVVTNAATAGKHLPLVLSVVLGAKDTEPPAMVSAVNASYDARGRWCQPRPYYRLNARSQRSKHGGSTF